MTKLQLDPNIDLLYHEFYCSQIIIRFFSHVQGLCKAPMNKIFLDLLSKMKNRNG